MYTRKQIFLAVDLCSAMKEWEPKGDKDDFEVIIIGLLLFLEFWKFLLLN